MSRIGPDPDQLLLLRAALWRGPRSLDAWRTWRARVDLDDVDPGSYRLLPLLHESLAAQGVDDPDMARLKGLRLRTWYANQMLFARCATMLERCRAAGIPTLVFKGGSIAALYYRDIGLRPMNDLDVLVPGDRVDDVMRMLREASWDETHANALDAARGRHHATFGSMVDGRGGVIDLHWHLLAQARHAAVDADFRAGDIDVEIGETRTRTLGPTEHLVVILVHGARFFVRAPLHWIPDAWTLLDVAGADIDWDRLVALVERRRFAYTVRAGIDFLCEEFGASVPPETRAALGRIEVSRNEILEHRYFAGDLPKDRMRASVRMLWSEQSRALPDASLLSRLTGLPAFARRHHGLKHRWQYPFMLTRAALRRAVRGARRTVGARRGRAKRGRPDAVA